MKRCQKGKSCGATCIAKEKVCLKDLPVGSDNLVKASDKVISLTKEPLPSKPDKEPTPQDILNQVNDIINLLESSPDKVENVDGTLKADEVNWKAGTGKGADYVASGAYGAFLEVPPDSLAKGLEGRFPGGVGVKYGIVTPEEVSMLKLVGDSGAGPKLIAAKVEKGAGVENKGMIAMERIPGSSLDKLYQDGKIKVNDLEDSYLRGIARLHRAGIMHGDAHLGNAILQPDGKVKFIDYGFAKNDPRRALVEALKAVKQSSGPIWNFDIFQGPVAEQLRANFRSIQGEIKAYKTGLRTEEENKKLALELIQKLYQGV